MADPRTNKKYYMKVLNKDLELFKVFLSLYDEAVKEGSQIPEDVAWIRFRERYVNTDEGWKER